MAGYGWIKLYRQITQWRWYKDSATLHIFLHLLLKASTGDGEYMQLRIRRGQLVTSQKDIATETGVSRQSIRTALRRLTQTGEISTKPLTKSGTLVTICNYDKYNVPKKAANQNINQQPTNNQPTTNQQEKEFKNIRYRDSESPRAREGKNSPSDPDGFVSRFFRSGNEASVQTLLMQFGLRPDDTPVLRRLAGEIAAEWRLADMRHDSYTDWARHLVNTMRIRLADTQQPPAPTAHAAPSRPRHAGPGAQCPPAQADYGGSFGSKDI